MGIKLGKNHVPGSPERRHRKWNFVKVKPEDMDMPATLHLLEQVVDKAEKIFVDGKIEKAILDHALSIYGGETEAWKRLKKTLSQGGIAPGSHKDHFHIRFKKPGKTPKEEKPETIKLVDQPIEEPVEDQEDLTPTPEPEPVPAEHVVPRGFKYGYVFGEAGSTLPLTEINSASDQYGASVSKIVLALMNLIISKDPESGIQRMDARELRALLNYKGTSTLNSNRVNRALSARGPSSKDNTETRRRYVVYRGKEIGIKSNAQVTEFLKKVDPTGHMAKMIRNVRYGRKNNNQTPAGMYMFLSKLLDHENNEYLKDHGEEVKLILDHMKRAVYTDTKMDREAKRWFDLKVYLNKRLPKNADGTDAITSIWGKGGKAFGALNFGIVINDKYVLSLYGQHRNKSGKVNKITSARDKENEKTLNEMVYNILMQNLVQQRRANTAKLHTRVRPGK
jgi:hypothetical protein